MEERPNFYAVIPANVRYDKRLKPIERLLYGEITALCNQEGYCFAKNVYFAKLYDCAIETISRYLTNIANCGYIKIVIENGYIRKIYLTDASVGGIDQTVKGGCPNNQGGLTEQSRGIDQTVKHNNTFNNIFNNLEKKEEGEPQKNDFEEVAKEYDKRYPMTLSSYKAQQLSDILDNYGKEAVLFAIREALSANAKKPIEYIRSVAMNKAREMENNAPAQREEKPKKKEEPKASKEFTEAMKEYQIAKNNGYAGSMFEFMNERKKRDGTCDAGLEGESVCKESETA